MSDINGIITGLQIVSKYGESSVLSRSDVFYAGHRVIMSPTDQKAMEDAGWWWDDDERSFAIFT